MVIQFWYIFPHCAWLFFQKSFLQTKPLEAQSIKLPIHAQVSNPSSLMLAKPSNGLLFSLGKIETFFFGIWHAKKKQVRKKEEDLLL